MRSSLWIIVILLLLSSFALAAEPQNIESPKSTKATKAVKLAEEIPPVIKNGFDRYAKEGPKAAIEGWTKGSAVEGNSEALAQDEVFRKLEEFYGKYVGYEFVKKHRITKSTSTYLLNIKYEKGNLYSIFYLYKKPDGNQIITAFNVQTNPLDFWPTSAIFGTNE
jgi:hypothetical protein